MHAVGGINTDIEDEELIARIANNDRQALEHLYRRHHVRIYRFIRRFVNNDATAEDLTNDVFLDVWQKAGQFEGRSKVTSWLLAIGRFKALSEHRKKRKTVDPDEALGAMEDPSDNPEVTAQKTDKGSALNECINLLSEDHRVIIDLVYYHERSIKEAAGILEIPENTVKTRMFHARKKLSEFMQQKGLDRGWP